MIAFGTIHNICMKASIRGSTAAWPCFGGMLICAIENGRGLPAGGSDALGRKVMTVGHRMVYQGLWRAGDYTCKLTCCNCIVSQRIMEEEWARIFVIGMRRGIGQGIVSG